MKYETYEWNEWNEWIWNINKAYCRTSKKTHCNSFIKFSNNQSAYLPSFMTRCFFGFIVSDKNTDIEVRQTSHLWVQQW